MYVNLCISAKMSAGTNPSLPDHTSPYLNYRTSAAWNQATCLSLCRGSLDESNMYAKSVILHQYLFGYELPELILLLNQDGTLHAMGTKKKMQFLKPATVNGNVYLYTRNKHDNASTSLDDKNGDDDDEQLQELAKLVQESGKPPLVGTLLKEQQQQSTVSSKGLVGKWEHTLTQKGFEFVDCTPGLSFVLAVKDESELDLMKKSSVLSNKLMKHGCIPLLEQIIDESTSITHEALAQKLDDMIEDPSKIGLKLPKDDVASCYFPIVQSGGTYDLKVSAMSDTNALSFDIILISLGARYQNYCSTLSRTFLVDPPRAVSEHYELLTQLHDACQRAMRPGKPLKAVHKAAVDFLLREEKEDLIQHLPKSLGFGMGLDFRDGLLALSAKNPATFKAGMTFALVTSFANLKMSVSPTNVKDEENSVRILSCLSLLKAEFFSNSFFHPIS
jgi:nucleosome binding factor SPN SPT16 subunit